MHDVVDKNKVKMEIRLCLSRPFHLSMCLSVCLSVAVTVTGHLTRGLQSGEDFCAVNSPRRTAGVDDIR